MNTNIIKKIEEIVGADNCTTREEDLHCYSFDGTGKIHLPEVVAFPDSTEQVADLMKLATEHQFSVVPRGAGTGMTGGAVPLNSGLVMPMSRLNRILEIDADNQVAIAIGSKRPISEPSTLGTDLERIICWSKVMF